MTLILDTLALAPVLLPAQVAFDPNDSGLPGIAALRTIVGAVMTVGLILLGARPDHLGRGLGLRCQQLQPPPGQQGEARCADLLRRRNHHRCCGHADQLLLERRPDGLLTRPHSPMRGGERYGRDL